MVDRMSYLEVTLEGKIQVQQVLPLLEDPVEVPPGRAEALCHGAVDLGPGLLGEDHLVRLPQQLLHRALLAVQRRDHINLGTCLGMIIHCSFQNIHSVMYFSTLCSCFLSHLTPLQSRRLGKSVAKHRELWLHLEHAQLQPGDQSEVSTGVT